VGAGGRHAHAPARHDGPRAAAPQPGVLREGVGDAGSPLAGADHPGDRRRLARGGVRADGRAAPGARRADERGDRAPQGALGPRPRDLRGHVLPRTRPHDRPEAGAGAASADLDRRRQPAVREGLRADGHEHRSGAPAGREVRRHVGAALVGHAGDGPRRLGEGAAVRAGGGPRPGADRACVLELRLGPQEGREAGIGDPALLGVLGHGPGLLADALPARRGRRARGAAANAGSALGGVLRVVTAADVRAVARPLEPRLEGDGFTPTAWPVLADGRVNFCGEAVAAVVATNAYVVADACERVRVEYEPLPAIASIEAALAADRVLFRRRHRQGDVDGAFARAPLILRETFEHARCAPSPLEPRGIIADWDGETLTVWASTQTPTILR